MTQTAGTVVLGAGAEDNGLANMVAGLIEQNLADHPDKRKDFDRMLGRVAIIAEDVGVSLTLVFQLGQLVVLDGVVGIPDLTVRAGSEEVVQMSLIELGPLGLPNPRGPEFRKVVNASRRGHIKLFGALTRPTLALRLTRLMSVN